MEGPRNVLRAVLFTDLVDSTGLRARLGDRVEDLRRSHDELLRRAVAARGGEVVKGVGDGMLATFPNAVDAVAAAAAMQQAIIRLSRRSRVELAMRVGVSLGDVVFDPVDGDCHGMAVIEAARLCETARGGQVLCSDVVARLVRGRGHDLEPVGDLELKGIPGTVGTHELRWPRAAPSEVPLPSVLRPGRRFPFVGRTAQRERLLSEFRRAAVGRPRTVLISGEPGVGKTRLVSEVAASVHADGAVVLAGRCDEDLGVPYQPFVEALRHYVEHHPGTALRAGLGRFGGDLLRLLPDLADRVDGLAPPLRSDEERERLRLFEAVISWLAAAADDRPVLLVLDDLHWAGTPTLLMLRHLLGSRPEMALMVVATYRDTDLDRSHPLADILIDLRREADVTRMRLTGLDGDEVGRFLEAAAGHELDDDSRALAETLHAETEGNVFFLEEVVVHLVESGTLFRGDDGRWTSDVASVEELGIPEGIRQVVGQRLSRLAPATNDVLRMAAVLGPEFDASVLAAMAGARTLTEQLEEAETAGVLVAVESPSATYAFTHALVRYALLDEISPVRRQQYHLSAADAQEAHGAVPSAIAVHLRQAGTAADPERVVDVTLAAAEQARHQHAWEEATSHWEAALELIDVRGERDTRTARLRERLGDAMYYTATDWERGIGQLERARELYDDLGEHQNAAKVRSKLARNLANPYVLRRDIRRAREHVEAALAVLERGDNHLVRGYAWVSLSNVEWLAGRHRHGVEAAQRALEIGDRHGLEEVQAAAKVFLGGQEVFLGRVATGLAHLDEGYDQAVRLGHAGIAWLGAAFAVDLCALADPVAAEARVDRELDSGRQDHSPGPRSFLLQTRNWALLLQGRDREVRDLADEVPVGLSEPLLLIHEGDWDAANRLAREWTRLSQEFGAGINHRGAGLYMGDARWACGDAEGAVEAYGMVVREAAEGDALITEADARASLTAPLVALGRLEEAREQAVAARSLLTPGEDHRGLGGTVTLSEAITAPAEADADTLFRDAIGTFQDLRLPWHEANALESWARRTGRVEHLDAALALYERIGAGQPWIERVRRLRARRAPS